MAVISDSDLLSKVKSAIGVGGTYQDATIQIYIDEVKEYLLDAGVNSSVVNSETAVGVICRGVSDLWNYGAGNAQLSLYFMQRASQLALKEPEPLPTVVTIENATLNINGAGVVKNGYIIMTDGSIVPINITRIPAITVTTTQITLDNNYTTATVEQPLSKGNRYMYSMRGSVPAYGEPISNYNYFNEWDGVSQIDTEGMDTLTIVECTTDGIAVKCGRSEIDVKYD